MGMPKPIRQVSQVTTTPAPVRGINSYDSIVGMEKGYALVLRNFYAQPYGCQVRKGYRKHVTEGIDGKVETLMAHNTFANKKIYAFDDLVGECNMYDVTTPNISAVPKVTGLTNARWQHTSISNVGGVNLVAVNGADDPIWVQANSNVARISAGDGTNNTISGVDPKVFIQNYVHQQRMWFVEKNSSKAWYLPPEQVFGEARLFDFGANWTMGGYLSQLITWTIDDGNGADDHLVAISSEGQVSVYNGTDVSAVDNWALQGVYFAGAPVGRRAAIRYGGDIIILTEFGIVLMSDLLKSTKVNPTEENFVKNIQHLVSATVAIKRDSFGWQPFIFPAANMVLINAPATEYNSIQFVMNDITKAWSQFLDYNAYCWELFDQHAYFGGLGGIYRAWEGYTDESTYAAGVETRGRDIRAEAQTAFDYFGSFGQQKHFKMIRPTFLAEGEFSVTAAVNTDFNFKTAPAPVSFSPPEPGVWDESLWSNATWAGGLVTHKDWQSAVGIGTAGAVRVLVRTNSETHWASTDWLYEVGGIL